MNELEVEQLRLEINRRRFGDSDKANVCLCLLEIARQLAIANDREAARIRLNSREEADLSAPTEKAAPTDAAMRLAKAVYVLGKLGADITVLAEAIDEAAGLPALERCRDVLAMILERAQPYPDADPAFENVSAWLISPILRAEASAALAEAKP